VKEKLFDEENSSIKSVLAISMGFLICRAKTRPFGKYIFRLLVWKNPSTRRNAKIGPS